MKWGIGNMEQISVTSIKGFLSFETNKPRIFENKKPLKPRNPKTRIQETKKQETKKLRNRKPRNRETKNP